jgi:hypothetical protein
MNSSLEEWASSLVGRDWEIFWTPDDSSCEDEESPYEPLCQNVPPSGAIKAPKKRAATDDNGDASVEDIEDWYDGHIDAIESRKENGNVSFHVRFVGDETIYTMVLEPSWVRPSARAWIKRSKALLNNHSNLAAQNFLTDWENSLPADTSTVSDSGKLAELQAQHAECTSSAEDDKKDSHQRNNALGAPEKDQMGQIRRLAYLLSAQVYLRSRLAPIVELQGGPSEVYVDHLLHCLKCLDESCRWYLRCWELHRVIFFNSLPPSQATTLTPETAGLNEDYAIREGLQEGRRVMIQLLKVDTSLAGAKRRKPPEVITGGTRKTKRRRKNKSFQDLIKESERGSEAPNPHEDDFLSSDVVNTFVEQVRSNDSRWYTDHFTKMLLSLSNNIVAPHLAWRRRVETLLGDRPDSELDNGHSDGETSEEDNDDEGEQPGEDGKSEQRINERKRYYNFDEIKAFEEAATHDPVLQKFNLSRWKDRLREKLSDIESFENHGWGLVSKLFSKPNVADGAKEDDEVFSELSKLRVLAFSSNSSMSNVSPLGKSSSVLSRKVLDDGILIRSWYLDLHRLESSKERLVFIDKMAARASELPRLPPCDHSAALDSRFDEAVARLRTISQRYFDHLTLFNKYRSILLARSSVNNEHGMDFLAPQGVCQALQELGDIRVLSVAEEMLAIRMDILSWKEEAQALLSQKEVRFEDLMALKISLGFILDGRSSTRVDMIASIEANDKVDAEIRAFAEADIAALCGPLMSVVNSKYSITKAWKERADSMMNAIKQYNGNLQTSQKPPPMVDMKRINGLLAEYTNLDIFLPAHHKFFEEVRAEASKWSSELTTVLLDKTKQLSFLLCCLQSSKTNRPSGLIVDPARHVVDSLVDLLLWHQQACEAQKVAMHKTGGESPAVSDDSNSTSSILKPLYPIIAEGSEILELFSKRTEGIDFIVNSVGALQLLSKQLDSRRPMRVQSCMKLESSILGSTMLGRIISEDEAQGSPLKFCLYLLWRATVVEFVEMYESSKGNKNVLTLDEAKKLVLKKPVKVGSGGGAEKWGVCFSSEESKLLELIKDGETKELEASKALALSKEYFRGPYRQSDAIRNHMTLVKELHNDFKMRLKGGNGLALNKSLEQQLDHNIKVIGWLVSIVSFNPVMILARTNSCKQPFFICAQVRTFPYPFLHLVHCDLDPENRIPWETLISLHDRKPGGLENMGDCAGIALRVADLFEAATKWQQEITKVTMLSNRGGKRRGEVSCSEVEGSMQATVDVETVRRLARNPVLAKVRKQIIHT